MNPLSHKQEGHLTSDVDCVTPWLERQLQQIKSNKCYKSQIQGRYQDTEHLCAYSSPNPASFFNNQMFLFRFARSNRTGHNPSPWELRIKPQQQSFYFKTSLTWCHWWFPLQLAAAKRGRPLSLNCQEDNKVLLTAAKPTCPTPGDDQFNHKFNSVIINWYRIR